MKYLETEHEKKSFAITSVIMALILLLCLYWGLTYLDPPPENGIAVNFGTTDFGSGNVNTTETVQTAPQQTQASSNPTPTKEEVLTQEDVDAAVINQTKKPNQTKDAKENNKPKQVENQKPSKETDDILSRFKNSERIDGKAIDGDGDDKKAGNKGELDGSIYAASFYGSGSGTGKWGLGNRSMIKGEPIIPDCVDSQTPSEHEGVVVIEIRVNKNGSVIDAKRSKGTYNSTQCLVNAAIKSAYNYKWNFDSNAPSEQVGYIVFKIKNGVLE